MHEAAAPWMGWPLTQLLLLEWGHAAHTTAAPWMGVALLTGVGCCSSDGYGLCAAASPQMRAGCLRSCCSSDGCKLCAAAAPVMGGCVLGPGWAARTA